MRPILMTSTKRDRVSAILANPETLKWRIGVWDRLIFAVYFVFVFVWLGLYQIFADAVYEGLAILLTGCLMGGLLVLRPVVAVDEEVVLVRNPFRVYIIPLSGVVEMRPEWEGLRIETSDGKSVAALALQRWNLTLFLKRRSRAEVAIEHIRRRQSANQGERPD